MPSHISWFYTINSFRNSIKSISIKCLLELSWVECSETKSIRRLGSTSDAAASSSCWWLSFLPDCTIAWVCPSVPSWRGEETKPRCSLGPGHSSLRRRLLRQIMSVESCPPGWQRSARPSIDESGTIARLQWGPPGCAAKDSKCPSSASRPTAGPLAAQLNWIAPRAKSTSDGCDQFDRSDRFKSNIPTNLN